MAIRKVKGILIDVLNNECRVETISYNTNDKNYLNAYYNMLQCDVFDIVRRKIGEHIYDIYVDDEGLMKNNLKPSVLTFDGERIVEVIVGNAFVCSHNEDGDTISLTDEELMEVRCYVQRVRLTRIEESRIVLLAHL